MDNCREENGTPKAAPWSYRRLAVFCLTLFGDLPAVSAGGAATVAQDTTLSLEATYTADWVANAGGGLERDRAYLDNLSLSAELNLGQLAAASDARVRLSMLYNNGTRFSEGIVGDNMIVSNVETGVQANRIYEAWINIGFGQSSDILFGLYDLNSEFDVLESSSLFTGSSHGIGMDIAQTGANGPAIFPVTGLAVRFAAPLSRGWTARLALLDGIPGNPDDPASTRVRLSSNDGVFAIAELARDTARSRWLLGAWGYTARFDPVAGSVSLDTGKARTGNVGLYLRAESVVFDRASTVSVFFRLGAAASRFNRYSRFLSLGIHWQGPFASRPNDEMGAALATAFTSSTLKNAGRAAGQPVSAHESALEVSYRWQINRHIALQPNIHYVLNPGIDPNLDDSVVLGLRLDVGLTN
ncbi:MAG: carbohydrate porin [Pseudomonadota bacterium]